MSINRIQFQPGLSLADFLKDFGTDAHAKSSLNNRAGLGALSVLTAQQPVPFSSDGAGPRSTSAALAGNRYP